MPIPLEFCEVWFRWDLTGDNEPMYSHLAYGVAATITQAAVDAGFSSWQTNWRSTWPPAMLLGAGHVLEQTTAGIRRWDASIAPLAGNTGTTLVPNNTAFLVKKSTALGGRRNRGRMYIPSPLETDVDNTGNVAALTITNLNTKLALLMPGGAIHTAFGFLGDPVVLHETGSQTPAVVTDLACLAKVATQRRRMRR
jgi:hypothetical protein